MSYVIKLTKGVLWRNFGANQPALFRTLENAQQTLAGLSGRGALADAKIMRVVSTPWASTSFLEYYLTDIDKTDIDKTGGGGT